MSTATVRSDSSIPWWVVLLQGIALVIVGVLLFVAPARTTFFLVQLLGIYWFIGGIFDIVGIFLDSTRWGWKLFSGILGILAGILIVQNPLWSTLLVPETLVIVFGIFGIIIGVINIIQAFQGGGWGIGLLGGLSILLGILLLSNLLVSTLVLPWVIAGFALVGGISAIIAAFRIR